MRILIVAGAFAPNRIGAPAIIAEQCAVGLRDLGHAVVVATGIPGIPGDLLRWDVAGVPVVGVAVSDAGPGLRRVAEVVRPDIVHVHSREFLGDEAVGSLRDLGAPVVATRFGSEPAVRADRVVVNDAAARDAAVASGTDPLQVRVVPHGAMPPHGDVPRIPGDGSLRLGFLGATAEDRGYRVLLAALREVRRSDYELHVVDRAALRGERAIRQADFPVSGLVRLVPGFSPRHRDRFFAGIDVLLALPQERSSTGLAVKESLLRGVWPIATESATVDGFVADGKNGHLVPVGSSSALAAAIGFVLDARPVPAPVEGAPGVPTVEGECRGLEQVYRELVPLG